MTTVLRASGLSKHFHGFRAVSDVSFSVEAGSIHSVIGSNGAGKTTLFNLLSGGLVPTAGTVEVSGKSITNRPPEYFVALGVVRTFQITSIFPELSVWENVALAVRSHLGRNYSLRVKKRSDRQVSESVSEILRSVNLASRSSVAAGSLSHGESRVLELGIGLGLDPTIMLLDEPMAGVSAHDRHVLRDLILNLRKESGLTVLLVEHDVELVLDISDRITVMHQGSVIADGSPAAIQQNEAVRASYLGAH